MKILIIAPPLYPVPAVEGGAIENLIDMYLKHNSTTKKFDITVYSIFSNKIDSNILMKYKKINFRHIKKNTITYRYFNIKKKLMQIFRIKHIPSSYSMYVINNLKKKDELSKYDLVIIENQVESLITYSKELRSPIVEHLHNDYLNINTKNSKEIVNSCTEIWGVSNYIRNQILEIDKNAVAKTLYNGVDFTKYTPDLNKKNKDAMYNKIGFSKKDYIVLFVGRIMPEKGVLELIRAFNSIKSKNDRLKLLIVGGKKVNNSETNNYYNRLLEEKKKNNDSIYFYGNANFCELKTLYSIANLQIVPSMWEEAFGLIAVEGTSFGLPVIVSNSGGLVEIVDDTEMIVDRKNIEKNISDKINEFYNNKAHFSVEKQQEKNLKYFDKKIYCDSFDNYIEELISKNSGGI